MNLNTINNVRRPLIAITLLSAFVYFVLQLSIAFSRATVDAEQNSQDVSTLAQPVAGKKTMFDAVSQDFILSPDSEYWQQWINFAALPQPTMEFPSVQELDNSKN